MAKGRREAGDQALDVVVSLPSQLPHTNGRRAGKMHFTRMDQGTDRDFKILKRVHEYTLLKE